MFDESKRIFDLVASRVVVYVVGDAGFIGRIEDDEIHCVLTDSTPRSNA
jgi:hypothetical protein